MTSLPTHIAAQEDSRTAGELICICHWPMPHNVDPSKVSATSGFAPPCLYWVKCFICNGYLMSPWESGCAVVEDIHIKYPFIPDGYKYFMDMNIGIDVFGQDVTHVNSCSWLIALKLYFLWWCTGDLGLPSLYLRPSIKYFDEATVIVRSIIKS